MSDVAERVCLPAIAPSGPARFVPPPDACDSHVHIYGDTTLYPLLPNRSFTPPPGQTIADLDRLHQTLGFGRSVIVQSGAQGINVMLDALHAEPSRLRGIAVLHGDVSDRHLAELNEAGVRGVRVNLFQRGGRQVYRGGAGFVDLEAIAPRVKRFGWHIQAWLDADHLAQWAPRLLGLGLDIVVDHMGRITTDRGVDSSGFDHLCELLRDGRVWCKLSGADRISVSGPPYADAVPYARALLSANRDQVVWGTDWPHVNYFEGRVPADTDLVDLLPSIAPDAADRQRLLVDNPKTLYAFN